MPKGRYTIGARGTHGCSGYPVVGDTGKVHGCHKTRAQARAQQAAIYASESSNKANYEYYSEDSAIRKNCCPETDVQKAQGPCWDGYEQRGMKEKDGKMVPNCVPKDTNKSSDNEDQSGESHDKKKKKKVTKSNFAIVENHPKCEGIALVETDGTTVLCYPDRASAEAALADMTSQEADASVRPDMNGKFWEGSFAPIR
jgi:hypothetical protein